MNKAKYEGLPAESRRVLDANSGMVAAEMAAKPWDEQGPVVEQMAKRRGNQVIVISEEEKARWVAATRPVVEQWQAGARERGFDGAALLEEARALVAKHGRGVS
jgi:TRAP-type C4-dicarboxylate transport system substrate-binding protein